MVIIETLLSDEEVRRYRDTLATATWRDGKATAMGMAGAVKRNHQADPQDPSVAALTNGLLARMGETAGLLSAALPHQIFPPCFNRYGVSEEYGYHVDAAVMRIPGSPTVIRSDVSMTLFLNDPEEYDGGELVIATEFGEQRVKLRAGQAVIYPSRSLHKVTAVTRGERLAAITWMQSMVADVSLRQSLYELDSSIQALMADDSAPRRELDRLHNVYHNLIRQFAQI